MLFDHAPAYENCLDCGQVEQTGIVGAIVIMAIVLLWLANQGGGKYL